MSLDNKLERVGKVTVLFDQFVEHLGQIKADLDQQGSFAEGYSACIADILDGLNEGKDTEIIRAIKTKIDLDSRKNVLDELGEGLSNLHKAYKKILDEE